MPEDFANLGRRTLSAMGLDPSQYDVAAYGQDARFKMGKGQAVPEPGKYLLVAPPAPGPRPPRVPKPPPLTTSARRSDRRGVRIGAFEISFAPKPVHIKHRRGRHRFERTTAGMYRSELEAERRRRRRQAASQPRRKDGRFKR